MTFHPSQELASATIEALSIFERYKPHVFRLGRYTGDRLERYVSEWACALRGVAVEVIPEAAREWFRSRDTIPTIATFTAFAKAFASARDGSPEAPAPMVPEQQLHIVDRDALSRLAYRRLQSWDLVTETWSLLMTEAEGDESRRVAVRSGAISSAEMMRAADTIAAVHRGVTA